jgi:hypothetical protein
MHGFEVEARSGDIPVDYNQGLSGIKGEVLVQGYRLDWRRMQKELQRVRMSAVDRFVNSMLSYGRR